MTYQVTRCQNSDARGRRCRRNAVTWREHIIWAEYAPLVAEKCRVVAVALCATHDTRPSEPRRWP